MSESAEAIFDRIEHRLRELGWTQKELANKTSIAEQNISRWKTAGVRPDRNSLNRVATALGLDPAYLEYGKKPASTEVLQGIILDLIRVRNSIANLSWSGSNKKLAKELVDSSNALSEIIGRAELCAGKKIDVHYLTTEDDKLTIEQNASAALPAHESFELQDPVPPSSMEDLKPEQPDAVRRKKRQDGNGAKKTKNVEKK